MTNESKATIESKKAEPSEGKTSGSLAVEGTAATEAEQTDVAADGRRIPSSDKSLTPGVSKQDVIEKLKLVEDPELFLDIWFLGLVYDIDLSKEEGLVEIEMTFTTPLCPAGPELVADVQDKVGELEQIERVEVKVVFSPPWKPNDEVKAMMGFL